MLNINTLISLKATISNQIAQTEFDRLDLKKDRKELLVQYWNEDERFRETLKGIEIMALVNEAELELSYYDKKLVKLRKNQKALTDEINLVQKQAASETAQARGWHFKAYIKSVSQRVKFFVYPAGEASYLKIIYELDDGTLERTHSIHEINQGKTDFYIELRDILEKNKGKY